MTVDVVLVEASWGDLPAILALERQDDTREFIVPNTLEDHHQRFQDPAVTYLKVWVADQWVGFAILVLDGDGVSVELARVIIAKPRRGVGQRAIAALEDYCRTTLGRRRLWLDVFVHNPRARHVYEKLGYQVFAEGTLLGKPLLYCEKPL
ncbi:MAG: GNAT family N-acetyltransferase [Candidatus Competibacterales bacterium]